MKILRFVLWSVLALRIVNDFFSIVYLSALMHSKGYSVCLTCGFRVGPGWGEGWVVIPVAHEAPPEFVGCLTEFSNIGPVFF